MEISLENLDVILSAVSRSCMLCLRFAFSSIITLLIRKSFWILIYINLFELKVDIKVQFVQKYILNKEFAKMYFSNIRYILHSENTLKRKKNTK